MRKDKIKRAMEVFSGHEGPATVSHIIRNIPVNLRNDVTGKQLGTIMNIHNKAYQEGKQAAIKEIEEYIGLPAGVSLWAVIGDKEYFGYKTFDDGLNIPDILESRGMAVKKWETEEQSKKRS